MNSKDHSTNGVEKEIQTTKIFNWCQEAYDKGYANASFQGGSRTGKTYNIMIWLIMFALRNPRIRIAVVRATRPALEASALMDFKDIMRRLGLFDERRMLNTKLIYTFENEPFFEFFGTDDEQRVKKRKRDILFCNEANELKPDTWTQLQLRTTKFTILDYIPSFSDDHWLCQVNAEKDRTFFTITTYKDNPFLEERIIREIESLREKNFSLWQIYGEGKQCMVEGLIFPNFKVVTKIPTWCTKRWVGIDYGFTNDPTAIVLVGLYRDELYLDEIEYSSGLLSKDIIASLNKRPTLKQLELIAENADPRLNKEISNAGFHVITAKKGKGSIEAGIMAMQLYNIHVTEHSYNVIKELRNYTYLQTREGKFLNRPIDKYNHAMDAIRYVLYYKGIGFKKKGIKFTR